MYFKVRCVRATLRVLISLAVFAFPFSLVVPLLQPFINWVFGSLLDARLNTLLSWAIPLILGLTLQAPLQFYKLYEFTHREINVAWWYGAWGFYWPGGKMRTASEKLCKRGESPLLQQVEETISLRGFPDEFEPEIMNEQLARGARPEAVLGKSKLVKTIPRGELRDVKIFESVFGATLLLQLRECGAFTERFVWQYRLHNRGRLFVIRLSKSRGEQTYCQIKEYLRR